MSDSDPLACSPPDSSVHGVLQVRMGCRSLLQGIFLTCGLNPCLLCLLYWSVGSLPLAPPEKLMMMFTQILLNLTASIIFKIYLFIFSSSGSSLLCVCVCLCMLGLCCCLTFSLVEASRRCCLVAMASLVWCMRSRASRLQ